MQMWKEMNTLEGCREGPSTRALIKALRWKAELVFLLRPVALITKRGSNEGSHLSKKGNESVWDLSGLKCFEL